VLTCTRTAKTGKPCRRDAADWPGQWQGYNQPPAEWPDLPRVVACWTHLTEDERHNCLEARSRANSEADQRWHEERQERRAAGIPDPAPPPRREPRPCIGECISQENAQGREADSASSLCARCDGYVCMSCGESPTTNLFGYCPACEESEAASWPDDDTVGWDEQEDVPPALDDKATLNSLVARIVHAGGGTYPLVQARINRQIGVRQRGEASAEQIREAITYTGTWLAKLQHQTGTATESPTAAAAVVLSSDEVQALAELLTDTAAVLERLRVFTARLQPSDGGSTPSR